ncbi:MAG: hypothetical protein V4649_06905 [Bacteroidota bacterium]
MKSWFVNIILLLSVLVATHLYRLKYAVLTDEDRLKQGIAGAKKYIGNGRVVIKSELPDGSMPSLAAYFLTPVMQVPPSPSGRDTVLLLQPLNSADSVSLAMVSSARVVWQNKDDRYQYKLLYPAN